jgi:hypothetical protein
MWQSTNLNVAAGVIAHVRSAQGARRGDVRCLAAVRPSASSVGGEYFRNAPFPAGIAQLDAFPGFHFREPIRRDGQHGVRILIDELSNNCRTIGNKTDSRGLGDSSEIVTPGMPGHNLWARFDRSRAQLRSGEIHENATSETQFAARAFQMPHHSAPDFRRVVCTIDPHAVHPVRKQFAHAGVIIRRVSRHCDHDPHGAMCRWRAEQRFGVPGQHRSSFGETEVNGWEQPLPMSAGKMMQRVQHRVDCPHRVRFRSAERRETQRRQLILKRSDIMMPQGQVMN